MEEQRKFSNFRELFTELYLDDVGEEKKLVILWFVDEIGYFTKLSAWDRSNKKMKFFG